MSTALLGTARGAPGRGRPRWLRSLAYFGVQYRRTWRSSLASNFVYPTLYLTAMGVGLGHLVNGHVGLHAKSLGGLSYLAYLAPGVLASSAMQIGVQESTYPILGAIRWTYAYLAMVASPLRPIDVLAGQLAFVAFRLTATCAAFSLVSYAFGALGSPEAVLLVPIGVLCGLAFSAPIASFSILAENDAGFPIVNRLIIIPLFLFSGTFFPVSQLPGALRVLAWATPLFHAVALARSASTGHVLVVANLWHLAYLLALLALGVVLARRSYAVRLSR